MKNWSQDINNHILTWALGKEMQANPPNPKVIFEELPSRIEFSDRTIKLDYLDGRLFEVFEFVDGSLVKKDTYIHDKEGILRMRSRDNGIWAVEYDERNLPIAEIFKAEGYSKHYNYVYGGETWPVARVSGKDYSLIRTYSYDDQGRLVQEMTNDFSLVPSFRYSYQKDYLDITINGQIRERLYVRKGVVEIKKV